LFSAVQTIQATLHKTFAICMSVTHSMHLAKAGMR